MGRAGRARRGRGAGLGRRCRAAKGAVAGAVLTVLVSGCGQSAGPAAASSLRLTEYEKRERRVLSERQQAEAIAAMESVAEGHEPVNPPTKQVRFTDVPAAAAAACARVEAAIVETSSREDEFVFKLRTVEDWPGELRVRRVKGRTVYEADAWIGRFPDMAARKRRAERLLRALEEEMEAFGRKPR